MEKVEDLIDGSEKLTKIFGYWPSFHDAEVIGMQFWRGDVEPEAGRYLFPVLNLQVHLWEITNEVNSGLLVSRKHTRATLRFHDISEFRMEGFNHQNAILKLSIKQEERVQGPTPVFAVDFDPAHGMGASFICSRVEIVDANPCSNDGKLP